MQTKIVLGSTVFYGSGPFLGNGRSVTGTNGTNERFKESWSGCHFWETCSFPGTMEQNSPTVSKSFRSNICDG